MIDYSDASDGFYVWIKRALAESWPEIAITAHGLGVQEKQEEIIDQLNPILDDLGINSSIKDI